MAASSIPIQRLSEPEAALPVSEPGLALSPGRPAPGDAVIERGGVIAGLCLPRAGCFVRDFGLVAVFFIYFPLYRGFFSKSPG